MLREPLNRTDAERRPDQVDHTSADQTSRMVVPDRPSVTIGLPTHNREHLLRRAIDSALAQTYAPIELVISDNASTDGTEALCRSMAARDPRIRYLRHDRDLGPTANFNHLFGACSGDYVLLLADDDWLDPNYVTACLQVLRADDSVALAAGQPRYMRDDVFVRDGVAHETFAVGGAGAGRRLSCQGRGQRCLLRFDAPSRAPEGGCAA